MGRVTDELLKAIRRQVDENGIVVWYDPGGIYAEIANGLVIDDATIARYADSFLRLRYEVDELLDGERPRLLVYVPLSQAEAHEPLIELASLGVEMYPGAPSRPCNTRLSVVARPLFDEVAWKSVEKGVESGRVTLADLERLAERPTGMLSLIFGTAAPEVIALDFLSSEARDGEIDSKGAGRELLEVLSSHLGLPAQTANEGLSELRARLARHVLVSEMAAGLPGPMPAQLASVASAEPGPAREACAALSRTWRLRNDLTETFVAISRRTAAELSLVHAPFSFEELTSQEAFLELEERLQEEVERKLRNRADEPLISLGRSRQHSFWSRAQPEVAARWVLSATSGELIAAADRVAAELKAKPRSPAEILDAYTSDEHRWCVLDTLQRRLETLAYGFDWDGQHEALNELRHFAAGRFSQVGGELAEAFVRAFQTQGFAIHGRLRQRDVFKARVAPAVASGKTAYVLVDALRFEMAVELVSNLGAEFDPNLEYVLGSVPSITEIGMAALLPGAEDDVELVDAGGGKVGLKIGEAVLRDRAGRMAFLKSHAGAAVYETKLEDVLANRKAVSSGIANAELVVVTSQEIDLLCEQGNIALARNTMDTVVRDLRRGLGVLARHGVQTIIVTADHGYLFGEEAGTDMTIDPPGGETVDIHRRVWIGRGGAAHHSLVRLRASDIGWKGGLEIAAPWNMACFRAGGARAYFHGGLAPQEIAVPVAVLKVRSAPTSAAATPFSWDIKTGAKTISTRFLSVHVGGHVSQLFGAEAPRVRVEVRVGQLVVSTMLNADYGLSAAGDAVELALAEDGRTLRPNVVVCQLHEAVGQAETASVHLLDAVSGLELASLSAIAVRISL